MVNTNNIDVKLQQVHFLFIIFFVFSITYLLAALTTAGATGFAGCWDGITVKELFGKVQAASHCLLDFIHILLLIALTATG